MPNHVEELPSALDAQGPLGIVVALGVHQAGKLEHSVRIAEHLSAPVCGVGHVALLRVLEDVGHGFLGVRQQITDGAVRRALINQPL